MSQTMFSESWYRVAALRPRLRSHAQIHRHVYRGEVWYVLQDHASGRFHRFTPVVHLLIGLMDGERTVQRIWDIACEQLADDVPSQTEVIRLMADLYRADVLQGDAPPDMREQHQRRDRFLRQKLRQYLGNPVSMRLPLYDPDRLLKRLSVWLRPLFGWAGALLWCATVLMGCASLAFHWNEFSNGMMDRVFSVENLLLMWLLFPLLKVVHELAHGLVVRMRGGEVHEMGVMLLLLMPIPYVDASAASGIASRRWRMLVGGAGMMAELFIAALAMLLWVYLEPGTDRAMAYNMVLMAGVSTLLFNGNPFLRYDAYYILADYLEIPNLGQRANEYLGYLVQRHAFGIHDAQAPRHAPGEPPWFVFYGITSFAYRMFMMATIVVLVAGKFFVFGVLMAAWSLFNMLVQPLWRSLRFLLTDARLLRHRVRALGLSGAFGVALLGSLFWLPAPSYTRSEGVVWAPEESQVRASVDGFIEQVLATPGQTVHKGDLLIRNQDPELLARMAVLQSDLDGLRTKLGAAQVANRVQAEILENQIAHARAALELARSHIAALELHSPVDGVFEMPDVQNAAGRFVQRGDLLAYVTASGLPIVRVVIAQSAADQVREGSRAVLVRSVEAPQRVLPADMLRAVPAATNQLPSATLSLDGGGKIGIDPAHQSELRTLEKLFVLDLRLREPLPSTRLGSRIYVRFEHAPEPIGWQWARSIQRLFEKKINV